MSIFFRLLFDLIKGDNDISKQQFSCIRIKAVSLMRFRPGKIHRTLILYLWKRKHIRRSIHIPVFPVHSMNLFIGRKKKVHFRFIGTSFFFQYLADHQTRRSLIVNS